MSETPRTDKFLKTRHADFNRLEIFARQLVAELSALKTQLSAVTVERDDLRQRLHGEHDAHMDCHRGAEQAEAKLAAALEAVRDASSYMRTVGIESWRSKHAAIIAEAEKEGK